MNTSIVGQRSGSTKPDLASRKQDLLKIASLTKDRIYS